MLFDENFKGAKILGVRIETFGSRIFPFGKTAFAKYDQ